MEQQSYQLHSEALLSQGLDYLKIFPELDEYTVEAADGHFIDHACHTEKNNNGKVYAAAGIYALNLRHGLLRFLCLVTNGTQRHQEIPLLRDHIEKQNKGNNSAQKHLYVYDKAVTDYAWWDQQKHHSNDMISMRKENSVATLVESIPFDSFVRSIPPCVRIVDCVEHREIQGGYELLPQPEPLESDAEF